MDDPKALRLVTIGLVLVAIAVGYLLFTGGFSVSKPKIAQNQENKIVQSPQPTPSVTAKPTSIPSVPSVIVQQTPKPTPTPLPTPVSAYNAVASRGQGNVQILPATGFPVGLAVIFSASAIVSGFSLRRFPK